MFHKISSVEIVFGFEGGGRGRNFHNFLCKNFVCRNVSLRNSSVFQKTSVIEKFLAKERGQESRLYFNIIFFQSSQTFGRGTFQCVIKFGY